MKKMTVALLVLVAMLSAAFVPQDIAKKAAENYYKNYAPVSAKGNGVTNIFAHEYEGQVTWYGVSFDQGFVLISADDAVRAILGYSFEGKIANPDERDGGLAFKEWFGYYDKQIAVARKYSYVDAAAQTEWKNIKNNSFPKASKSIMVDALCKAKWDQVWPWNDLCPEKDGTWTYVGCVATAASIIAKYHEWPTTGTGSNTNTSAGTTETYSNYTFDYSVMKDEPVIEYGLYPVYWESIDMDAAAIQTMAELNYLTGHSFDMSYGTTADGGSGANMSASSTAFQTHWFYNTTYATVGTPTDPTYIASTIQAELDAKRPWWWAGGVHSFVLDGYTDDYWYHFNWGWGGYEDGWYQINYLVPGGIGSGGGDGDYTASQIRISCVPNTDPFTAWPAPNSFNGSLANAEDVSLTWSAPTGGGQDSYNIYKSTNLGAAVLVANTASTSYVDNDQTAGDYAYYATAVYGVNESHNTDSYSVSVVPVAGFPVIRNYEADPVGRTSIDLTWTEPFTGVIFFDEDFEAGTMIGWVQKQSEDPGAKPPVRDFFKDNGDGWAIIDATTFSSDIYIHSGDYAAGLSYTAGTTGNGPWSWNFTPEFTIAAGGFCNFWVWYKNNEVELWYTNIRAYLYQGDFTEQSAAEAAANLTNIFFWEGSVLGEAGNNLYDSEVLIDLGGYSGTYRFAWAYEYTDGYQLAVDDLLLGTNSGGTALPDEYEVYRNGSLATTHTYTGTTELWADTNFIDGDNSYYVRAIYPTGESLSSPTKVAYMNADPKPDYLTGVLNGSDVDLAWYMPYGTPSHWSSYIAPENCITTVDYLDDTDCAKRRANFTASAVGLYYPVSIDSIAGGFYEWSDEPWGANTTFTIRLWDGTPIDGTLLWESGILTATSGEVYKVALDQTYVLNNSWNVEVETYDLTTGHPSTLAGPSTSGATCYFYYSAETSYSYYVTSGGIPLAYCLMAHVTGSDPDPIIKVAAPGEKVDNPVIGWATNEEVLEGTPVIDKSGRLIKNPAASSKGIDTYNVYRNGGYIGSTSLLAYTDNSPVGGDNTYYVKAAYVSPVGESAASNEVIVTLSGLPAPTVTSTGVSGGNLDVTWDAVAGATGYVIYSSGDPYGTFSIADTVGTPSWSTPTTATKMFYYIIATDAKTVVHETIEVEAQHK